PLGLEQLGPGGAAAAGETVLDAVALGAHAGTETPAAVAVARPELRQRLLVEARRQLVQPPQRGGGRLLSCVGFFQSLRLARIADPEPADERLEREALDEERYQNHQVREEDDEIAYRERGARGGGEGERQGEHQGVRPAQARPCDQ